MSLAQKFWTFVVDVLVLPLHVIKALGLFEFYKRVFPLCVYRVSKTYNKKMHDKKTELFREIPQFSQSGKPVTILEIGCGSGTNFEYFPPGCKVVCTDPNPHFKKYLEKSMAQNDHLTYANFVVCTGEDLSSVEDGSVDVVVCTLVLCTVNNIPQTLREVHRVLRPGGAFLFMEHVAANPSTWTRFFQHVFQPFWVYFGDGCETTRETWKYLEAGQFSDLKLKHIEAPLVFMIKPHITGCAVK